MKKKPKAEPHPEKKPWESEDSGGIDINGDRYNIDRSLFFRKTKY